MTRIGAMCLVTIGVWVVIELAVQFGHYRHQCRAGSGAKTPLVLAACTASYAMPPSCRYWGREEGPPSSLRPSVALHSGKAGGMSYVSSSP